MLASELKKAFEDGQFDQMLKDLYLDESQLDWQKERYANACAKFIELYGDKPAGVFTAAGRSEVSGNHTDHQHGRVLAASINLDSIAIAAPKEGEISVVSDSYNIAPVSLDQLEPNEAEFGTSEGLIRGVAADLKAKGANVDGFEAYITSNVLAGAGLSSSASFEVLIGTILSGLYNNEEIDMVEIAKSGQKAENVFFGKPCGLMDQCACAVGGLITIDFKDPSAPDVRHVDTDFSKYNSSLAIIDTKGSHADLTDEYAAVPAEMKNTAKFFGKDVLREVDPAEALAKISEVREACGDRAVLRMIHFFNENDRVPEIVAALENDDYAAFCQGILESGNSSYKFLQNVYASGEKENQAVSVGLAAAENLLKGGKGVSRVHGGGFAGTIQAFVDNEAVEDFKNGMDAVFGEGSCHILKIRPVGGAQLIDIEA